MGSAQAIRFGRFTLDSARRQLTAGGAPLALSSRGFDILEMLVAHRDRVVTKDEIFARVWPGVVVEENNLAVQISALRRALAEVPEGPALIKTVPGRGYRFVGEVQGPAPSPPPDPAPPLPPARAAPRPRSPARALALGALAAGLLVVFYLAWHRARPPSPPAPPPPPLSIAVLPFRNLGADRNDDYLADAVSDDLTTDLSHLPGSLVIARESADSFRNRQVPTPEIGRALNVRYLLEGSLRGADGAYSINAQLIEAATGAHLWAERFVVPRARISESQDTIVGRIASALNVQLTDVASRAPIGTGAPFDQLYRARSIMDRSDTLASITTAQGLLESARAAQPQDVDILVELAKTLIRKIDGFQDPDAAEDHAEARQVVQEAATLAPGSPDVMAVHGFLLAEDGDCQGALKIFQDVLATYDDSLLARSGLAHCLTKLNRNAEAAGAWRKLLQIDPFGPSSRARAYQLGRALLFLGRPEEALIWLDRSAADDPAASPGRPDSGRREWGALYKIAALQMSGQQERAEHDWREFDAAWPHRTTWRLQSETQSAEVRRSAGFQAILAALRKAGMPEFTDENAGGVAEPAAPARHDDPFAPTPLTLAGKPFVSTAEVERARTISIIVDIGRCDASVPGAYAWAGAAYSSPAGVDPIADLAQAVSDHPVVVMGDGPFGWGSYDLAHELLRRGVAGVRWYRGGEEAWAQARLPRAPCRYAVLGRSSIVP